MGTKRRKLETAYTFERCGGLFKRKKSFDNHNENCTEDSYHGDKLQRALGLAYDMVYTSNLVTVYTRHESHPLLSSMDFNPEVDGREVKRGWARRPKWGKALGESTILEFKAQIKQWFYIGSAEPAKKLSACRMQKLLQGLNPHRYNLPTEKQIQSLITGFSQDEKRAIQNSAILRNEQRRNEEFGRNARGSEQGRP